MKQNRYASAHSVDKLNKEYQYKSPFKEVTKIVSRPLALSNLRQFFISTTNQSSFLLKILSGYGFRHLKAILHGTTIKYLKEL